MSIIEEAAKRLDELKRAGMSVPDVGEGIATIRAVPVESTGEKDDAVPELSGRETSEPDGLGSPVNSRECPADEAFQSNEGSLRRFDINLADLAAKNFITADALRSRLADEFRVIKRPLLVNAQGKGEIPIENGNLIMVTSALPGEGKSFTAINLAMSIAMEMDIRVLLVDADISHPSVHKYLGLPVTKGLLDVLLDEDLDMREVMVHTNVEKLTILSGGKSYKHATELLASESMRRLIAEIGSRYSDRIIIFDSPPLLVTTESRVLATHMGQIVMVVEAGKTPHAAVKQALTTIESCPVVMMMLNKSAASHAGGYGYGYYGYGRNGNDSYGYSNN
ncbi:tyrosine-protein kinase YwqD [mine drainage metagenome]|uniref:non-specific protein-tyrosine kinase n=1 Tax=mine drainage metagenome TaxID=410659 RepID=A0A1J5T4P1_9ZZZZ